MDEREMVSADEARAHMAEMSKSLAVARRDHARLLGDYQELVARLVLTIEAGATTADAEATRLMVADHAAGRGIDGCCVETARRIADAIRATDTADARARRIAAQRTAERTVIALRAAAVAAGHPAADGDPDAQLCAVRAAAWNAGAEAMREAAALVVANRAAWADYRTEHHIAPGDDPEDTAAQAAALDGALAEIRALPLPEVTP